MIFVSFSILFLFFYKYLYYTGDCKIIIHVFTSFKGFKNFVNSAIIGITSKSWQNVVTKWCFEKQSWKKRRNHIAIVKKVYWVKWIDSFWCYYSQIILENIGHVVTLITQWSIVSSQFKWITVNLLTTNVPIILKPVSRFALQISWLVSIWWEHWSLKG